MNIDLKRAENDAAYLSKVIKYMVDNINNIDERDLYDIEDIVDNLVKKNRREQNTIKGLKKHLGI